MTQRPYGMALPFRRSGERRRARAPPDGDAVCCEAIPGVPAPVPRRGGPLTFRPMDPDVLRTGSLLERHAELTSIDAGLAAAAAGRGGVLVVEGTAGIGKTRLLDAARTPLQSAGSASPATC